MPPRTNQGQSSFSVSQESQQVICPLKNQDGTNCRKRCLGEKRFRSMQEHIRRAHPEHYIPKLPATEESFRLMIESPPQAKPSSLPASQAPASKDNRMTPGQEPNGIPSIKTQPFMPGEDTHMSDYARPPPGRSLEDQHPMAATAAVALAQLHNQGGNESSVENSRPRSSYELPPLQQHAPGYPRRELLPSMLDHSPPGRSTTLPPIQADGNRPRNRSIGENNNRIIKHTKRPSNSYQRRLSMEGRKAFSVEPPGSEAFIKKTKRWEDLVEAATSIRGDDSDRDLTPIPGSPHGRLSSVPPLHVPSSMSRHDLYKASPLARALTPPPVDSHMTSSTSNVPFPSIESSGNTYPSHAHSHSQSSFPTSSSYPSDSSPQFHQRSNVEIYCANCRRVSLLKESFACVDCIAGFCVNCVYQLSGSPPGPDGTSNRGPGFRAQRPCPKCRSEGGIYKPFQLDMRN